ncbi:LysR family transcriptional regulator [Aeromicrobium duanguangcaii]|uniref:LysR family transcriptional regulator n=1 Tax=Aeromicrobium duanguangcaii TaxID=2968086 RepID=A0ABY5KG96_9ACTN|nr:LysR family transcriptional regulator [Aeromicrobium duanguangcaii]MCD9153427.1 LysR family transcriptional regulator [Aeromicrobium duanguangcaii]UUI69482.1 LysR family transcriptional regulator [Aeromicrobium duanguangcaii]
MRLEQLEYVRAVGEHGSLRRAGEHLHVSLPALSEAVTKLERELGVTLLDRHRSGTRINGTGRELLPRILEVLDAADRLRAAARGESEFHRPVRVGSVYFGMTAIVLPAMLSHEIDHEHTTVDLRQLRHVEVRDGLRDGSLDFGLVSLLPGDDVPPDLEATELIHGRPVAVLPGNAALARQARVSVDDLRQEVFIGARPGYLMDRVARRVFGDSPPLKWHTADSADVSKQMVSSGIGVSLMPDFGLQGDPLEANGALAFRPIDDEETVIRLVMLRRRGGRPAPAARALFDHVARHAALHVNAPA